MDKQTDTTETNITTSRHVTIHCAWRHWTLWLHPFFYHLVCWVCGIGPWPGRLSSFSAITLLVGSSDLWNHLWMTYNVSSRTLNPTIPFICGKRESVVCDLTIPHFNPLVVMIVHAPITKVIHCLSVAVHVCLPWCLVRDFIRLSVVVGLWSFAVTENTSFTPRWRCVTRPSARHRSSCGHMTLPSMPSARAPALFRSSRTSRSRSRSNRTLGQKVGVGIYVKMVTILWSVCRCYTGHPTSLPAHFWQNSPTFLTLTRHPEWEFKNFAVCPIMHDTDMQAARAAHGTPSKP